VLGVRFLHSCYTQVSSNCAFFLFVRLYLRCNMCDSNPRNIHSYVCCWSPTTELELCESIKERPKRSGVQHRKLAFWESLGGVRILM
jgi:hypothetical protein